ncbi:hypothetical protein BGZ47_010036 [Haplosporangium gracile]|nr:hypothetical protein BGZ47_010036 [Haplosporangium gracile]
MVQTDDINPLDSESEAEEREDDYNDNDKRFLNMMLALKVSNSNQSKNMQDLMNILTKLDGKLAQQRIQTAWMNDMLAALAKAHISYGEQIGVLHENTQALQQAIDAMARQQLVAGSLMPGNSGYFGFSAPSHFPHQGPSVSSRSTTRENKQSKSGKDQMLSATGSICTCSVIKASFGVGAVFEGLAIGSKVDVVDRHVRTRFGRRSSIRNRTKLATSILTSFTNVRSRRLV